MTPTRLRECLAALGWSQRAFGDVLGCGERRARGWASGREPVPEDVAAWMERLAAVAAERPKIYRDSADSA